MLKGTVSKGAVLDAPEVTETVPNRCCDTCATMKATHSLVELPSRDICLEPGDVVAANVIGTFNVSLDKFKYVLTVQDLHSGMVSAIPIKTKGDATAEVIKWIRHFNNLSKWKVKRL
jgi:exosome complex RNA-binding protein Csl4